MRDGHTLLTRVTRGCQLPLEAQANMLPCVMRSDVQRSSLRSAHQSLHDLTTSDGYRIVLRLRSGSSALDGGGAGRHDLSVHLSRRLCQPRHGTGQPRCQVARSRTLIALLHCSVLDRMLQTYTVRFRTQSHHGVRRGL